MEENKLLVIDASVIIKWLLNKENDTALAEQIFNDLIERKVRIIIPAHCYAEVANTVARKAPTLALNFISKLKMSTIKEQTLNVAEISFAFGLMHKYPKVSFYDAAYHALAISAGATFVTADENYYKTTKRTGNITLLKHYC